MFADRLSCSAFMANQFRLLLHTGRLDPDARVAARPRRNGARHGATEQTAAELLKIGAWSSPLAACGSVEPLRPLPSALRNPLPPFRSRTGVRARLSTALDSLFRAEACSVDTKCKHPMQLLDPSTGPPRPPADRHDPERSRPRSTRAVNGPVTVGADERAQRQRVRVADATVGTSCSSLPID